MKANFLRLAILAVLAGSVYAQEKMGGQPATMTPSEPTTTNGAQESTGQGQEQQHMMQPANSDHMNDAGYTKKDHKMKKEKMKKQDGTNHDSVDQYDPMAGNWG